MRPNVILLCVVGATACFEEPADDSVEAPDYTIDVYGSFEPADPDDPESLWVGTEYASLTDGEGFIRCEQWLDAEGTALPDESGKLTFDIGRAELREPSETCAVTQDRGITLQSRYLSFDPEIDRFGESRGLVSVSDDLESWEPYGAGLLIDGALVYHGVRTVDEDAPDRPRAIVTWPPQDTLTSAPK